jgi:hypothetical protein
MSNRLAQSFQSLSLNNDPRKGDPPIPLTIPQINTYGRPMFFGIETTEEWLVEYAKKGGFDPEDPPSTWVYLSAAWGMLCANSGLRLIPQSAFAQNQPIPPRNTPVTYPLPKYGAHIVAICSNGPRAFPRRPSQAQVDRLRQIMGRDPMWWVAAS